MSNKINSVSRVHETILSITGATDQTSVTDVWALTFDIKETDSLKKAALVSEKLVLLLTELKLAENEIAKSFPSSTYSDHFTKLNNAFSPIYLSANWNSVRQYLSVEVMSSLAIFREAVPNEEDLISADELNELHARISELEHFLEKSSLPERVVQLIKRHITLIREALSNYKISGAKALIEARRNAIGELVELKGQFENIPKNSPEVSKLGELWEKVNDVADLALRVEGAIQLGKKVIELICELPN